MTARVTAEGQHTVQEAILGAQCKPCLLRGNQKKAVGFCVDCNAYICTGCEDKHKQLSLLRSHVVEKVANPCEVVMHCKQHPEEDATYWCETCNTALCAACLMYEHAEHVSGDIRNYFTSLTSEADTFEISLSNLRTHYRNSLSVINAIVNNLDIEVTKTEKEIRSHCLSLIKQIMKTENYLIRKLKSSHQHKYDNLKNEAQQESENIQQVTKWLDNKNCVFESVCKETIIPNMTQLVSEGKILSTVETAIIPETDFVEFIAKDNTEIGNLEVSRGCLNIKPAFYLEDGEDGEARDLLWISDDMLAVLHAKSIRLYDLSRDHVTPTLLSTTCTEDHNMYRIAARDLTIYATCFHANCKTVHQYTVSEGEGYLVENTKQWQRNMFDLPCGIAVTKSQNIIISDMERRQVTMHNKDGTRLLTIGQDTDVSFLKPAYVASGTDCIIVSDLGTHYIYVFNMEGKLETKFGGEGSKNGQLNKPVWVCTDKEGNILVADKVNRRISQFDSRGHFICHILACDYADISKPARVAIRQIHQTRTLVVRDDTEDNEPSSIITIYDI